MCKIRDLFVPELGRGYQTVHRQSLPVSGIIVSTDSLNNKRDADAVIGAAAVPHRRHFYQDPKQ